MKIWEYEIVEVKISIYLDEPDPTKNMSHMDKILNSYGKQGWECYQITSWGSGYYHLFMKRSVEKDF